VFALEADGSEYDSDAQAVALKVSVAMPPTDGWLTPVIHDGS
jgi:hypothetical protein